MEVRWYDKSSEMQGFGAPEKQCLITKSLLQRRDKLLGYSPYDSEAYYM